MPVLGFCNGFQVLTESGLLPGALLRNAGNLSGEGAALARQELSRRMADAQVRLGDFRQTANDQAMRLRTTTEDYVRREPFKAVGMAAAVGALVALVVARR